MTGLVGELDRRWFGVVVFWLLQGEREMGALISSKACRRDAEEPGGEAVIAVLVIVNSPDN